MPARPDTTESLTWAEEKVIAVRNYIEGTELVLEQAGYRDVARELYKLRLDVSDLVARMGR